MLKGLYTGLRAIEREDLDKLLSWRNIPEFRRYFREYRELSTSNQNDWFEKIVLKDMNTIMFAIEELSSGELLGASGLCYIDWINKSADFSIYIGKDNLYIDEKYADDAAKIMVTYAFEELGLHRLWSEIYDFDTLKQNFFDRLGFELDGCHRHTHWSGGKWNDSLFYSKLSDC
ncbi:GNAT family N-acetyltransferase [Paenibacillus sp. GM2]|uniref:GNAT family N-acetyltransferase n=1 Tax=Paenibacillus sp. GM2 TaxID=1622070 RepID=UPI000838886A|nr:GNAT family protein [Paenibacillus sp. GM2]